MELLKCHNIQLICRTTRDWLCFFQLSLTHPSYRINFGTNPDHARNALANCGIRQPEYGDRRIHFMHSRKKGPSYSYTSSALYVFCVICSYTQIKKVHFSYPNWGVSLTCRGFCWMLHVNFFSSNYKWHRHTRWVACSLLIGVFVFLIQMASFICQVILFDSLSMIFAPSQSIVSFSVVAWSVMVDLLMTLVFFTAPCVFLIVHVVCVLPVLIQLCFQ